MQRSNRRFGRLFALLWLGGCATPNAVEAPQNTNFAEPAAAEVISVGFDNITDKYIDTIALKRIGVEGLRGLGSIDAGLNVQEDGSDIVISENGTEIGRMRFPGDTDTRAWAAAVVALTETARANSVDIRAAPAERIYEAIFDGALSDLDIFSRYAGNEEAGRNRAKRDGFGGIGIRFRIEGGAAIVTQVVDESPAAEIGLIVGDHILAIDGHKIGDLSSRAITEMIRGPVHTHVKLTLKRDGAQSPFPVDVARAHIVPQTVTTRVENGIGVVRIASFNQETASGLEKALTKMTAPGSQRVHGIILDLRGNPGGLLRQSIKVADLLLTQGDILRTVGRHPESLHHYTADGGDMAAGLPLVVMVDGKSASAAEIVAAALQDRDRAVVIGTSSYGKGSVQTVIRLPNDGEITLTWSKFVAPSGYYLHGLGVVPTVCTSGKTRLSEAAEIIDGSLQKATAAQPAYLRQRAFLKDEERAALRGSCPAESRIGPLDLEIAKRLIEDKRLHARALTLSTATAQVTN